LKYRVGWSSNLNLRHSSVDAKCSTCNKVAFVRAECSDFSASHEEIYVGSKWNDSLHPRRITTHRRKKSRDSPTCSVSRPWSLLSFASTIVWSSIAMPARISPWLISAAAAADVLAPAHLQREIPLYRNIAVPARTRLELQGTARQMSRHASPIPVIHRPPLP